MFPQVRRRDVGVPNPSEHATSCKGTSRSRQVQPGTRRGRLSAAHAARARPGSSPLRGEHNGVLLTIVESGGSSPPARGARKPPSPTMSWSGIIPAFAGSTFAQPPPTIRRRDHPRIRGEHVFLHCQVCRLRGSSPHSRGALRGDVDLAQNLGIIPAFAGSTCPSSSMAAIMRDHPRIRGEHHPLARLGRTDQGSSPHSRGAPIRKSVDPDDIGIIPAFAGSTFTPRIAFCRRADHPRIRGEHKPSVMRHRSVRGSSPHSRGAHSRQECGGGLHFGSSPHSRGAP